jgi:hypothetical protein
LCTKTIPVLSQTNQSLPISSILFWSAEWYLVKVRTQTVNILLTQFAASCWKCNWGRTVERISFFVSVISCLSCWFNDSS